MAASASTSSSSSSHPSWTYEAYVSYRGEDTHKNITAHLYSALRDAGINTFRDDYDFQRGEEIASKLLSAVQRSKISIIVFSRNYAASSWCLEELVKIMECRRTVRQLVLPIFYHVEPSDVRNQTGSFAQAFLKHEKRYLLDKVLRSRRALIEAANLSGWDRRNTGDGFESLVRTVVKDIIHKRIPTNLNISIYPLRYDTCHEYLSLFLQVGSKDVLIVGICGPSRMGKTAIAEAIYNQICFTFEGSSCFLAGVGQNSKQPNGLVHLQEKLLSDILSERNIAITNITRGMDIIKEKLCSKRVLIVLDDVDDLDQLYSLVGNRSWFGLGSKIIITTTKVHLLNFLGVDQIFLAQGLPLPQNIQDIWEPFQQSCRMVAVLSEYLQALFNQAYESERYLIAEIERERRKRTTNLQQSVDQTLASTALTSTTNVIMHGMEGHDEIVGDFEYEQEMIRTGNAFVGEEGEMSMPLILYSRNGLADQAPVLHIECPRTVGHDQQSGE